jgi:hypothetical protein
VDHHPHPHHPHHPTQAILAWFVCVVSMSHFQWNPIRKKSRQWFDFHAVEWADDATFRSRPLGGLVDIAPPPRPAGGWQCPKR